MTPQLFIPGSEAENYCLKLMDILDLEHRIDFESDKINPAYSTDCLFSESRGQMFGVLVCHRKDSGEKVILKAFSGQYNGKWNAPGWVPPILDPEKFEEAVKKADPPIKKLTAEILKLENNEIKTADAAELTGLKEKRKQLSQAHMREIHKLYTIRNFAGDETDLFRIFNASDRNRQGIPAGTGDCCAPKLLNEAILQGIEPLSLAEFYWGRGNRSGTKKHSEFYPPCNDKCVPLLKFMLSGAYET